MHGPKNYCSFAAIALFDRTFFHCNKVFLEGFFGTVFLEKFASLLTRSMREISFITWHFFN